jgi:hypothetical protein
MRMMLTGFQEWCQDNGVDLIFEDKRVVTSLNVLRCTGNRGRTGSEGVGWPSPKDGSRKIRIELFVKLERKIEQLLASAMTICKSRLRGISQTWHVISHVRSEG